MTTPAHRDRTLAKCTLNNVPMSGPTAYRRNNLTTICRVRESHTLRPTGRHCRDGTGAPLALTGVLNCRGSSGRLRSRLDAGQEKTTRSFTPRLIVEYSLTDLSYFWLVVKGLTHALPSHEVLATRNGSSLFTVYRGVGSPSWSSDCLLGRHTSGVRVHRRGSTTASARFASRPRFAGGVRMGVPPRLIFSCFGTVVLRRGPNDGRR